MSETTSKQVRGMTPDTTMPKQKERPVEAATPATPATDELHDRDLDQVAGGDLYMHNPAARPTQN